MCKWLLPLSLAGLCIAQTAPTVQPTFRVGTRLVQLDVVVLNDKTPIGGLTKDDFTVQDKGKPQNIAVFSVSDGHKAPKVDPLPPNVSSNRINSRGEGTSTATVILFDKLNTPSIDQVVARRQALELLSSLKETDRVAFCTLETDLTVVQDFTEGADRLAAAAKALSTQAPGAQPAAGAAQDQALESALQNSLKAFQQGVDGSTRVASTMSAFRTIARHLEGLPGRKNLIWLTASIPFTYGSGAERRQNDQAEFDRMERLMSEANVAIYAVDPRGAGAGDVLVSGTDTNSAGGQFLGGRAGRTSDNTPNTLGGTQGMQVISANTGGKAYYNTNDLAGALREILDTTEIAYTLGFYVNEKSLDNKNHDLTVKLAKKPETSKATLHYRKSYAALNAETLAKQQPPPTVAALAAEALDAAAIGVMAASAPDPSKPGIHAVQVRVDASDLQFEHRGGKWAASFDLGLAVDNGGGGGGNVSVKTINLDLTDDQLKQALAGGVTINNTVPSPSQPSKLRIVVQDRVSGAAGSVRIAVSPR